MTEFGKYEQAKYLEAVAALLWPRPTSVLSAKIQALSFPAGIAAGA